MTALFTSKLSSKISSGSAFVRSRTLRFSGWSSLVTRILVVNLLAVLVLAGGLLYLENFRARLLETRAAELVSQGEIMALFLAHDGPGDALGAVEQFSTPRGTRVRLYAENGGKIADNWQNPAIPRFQLQDPTTAGFPRRSARAIDRAIDWLTGQAELPPLAEPDVDRRAFWPEAERAATTGMPATMARQTVDRLIVLQAAVPLRAAGRADSEYPVVMLTIDTPDVIHLVRSERQTSFFVFLVVLAFSLALSFYLARIIVVPLRQLARAAHRVRLGRAREVIIPRLPNRRDEIGGLARALADMTATLRHRIDATEAFAADVAHELKNPLASLRSAVETLGRVDDEKIKAQLLGLIDDDVRRIDRLISDISAASRLDAELSRARLRPVDLALLARTIVEARVAAGPLPNNLRLLMSGPRSGRVMVAADPDRLGQVVNNLVDNALSFSPPGGTVHLQVQALRATVELVVEDEGPGVPPEARQSIFERFYSERPTAEHYGRHSGLGLSIARAIVEALDGQVSVGDRFDGKSGARFVVTLPRL